jgi:hypothetical protein
MSRIPVYNVAEPDVAILRQDDIDGGEQGSRGSLTRLGVGNGSLLVAELEKRSAVQVTEHAGIEATTISDAASFAISNLFDLVAAETADRVQWKRDLSAYLERYASTDAWQAATLSIDGTDVEAYQLTYGNGRAVITDAGDLFLAVSAYPAPDTVRLHRQRT